VGIDLSYTAHNNTENKYRSPLPLTGGCPEGEGKDHGTISNSFSFGQFGKKIQNVRRSEQGIEAEKNGTKPPLQR